MATAYIIEDDPWQAEQHSRNLQAAGYRTRQFTNGVEAVAALDDDTPSVIVLDMLLTGTTGITLLQELQSYTDTAQIPVVLCTGLADDVSLDELLPYGVRRILDKTSMQPDDIVTAVRSVV